MGLFSKLGQSIKGAVSKVTKGISLNNAIKVVSGDIAGVGKDLAGRALQGAATPFVAKSTPTVIAPKTVLPTPTPTQRKTGLTGNPIVDAAIGGALAGAGVGIGGTAAGNAAVNATGWTALKTWVKNNWIAVTAGVVGVGAAIWYFAFRKPKAKFGFKRK